ncbi:MAG TPA: hypothetical protein DEH25_18070 [Chloroflexi bacterium]|nr:hypothetical protein [Chloroflexota bacterium]HBY07153.1 hypothetical protein [Chloroflexota bacterium]
MKILIADDKDSVRYGLAAFLEEQTQVEIVGEAVNFKDLLHLMLIGCPEMILLSWNLPGQRGKNLLNSVRLICPEAYIVVMSSQIETAEEALSWGADNFISKAEPPERLLEVIHQAMSRPTFSSK